MTSVAIIVERDSDRAWAEALRDSFKTGTGTVTLIAGGMGAVDAHFNLIVCREPVEKFMIGEMIDVEPLRAPPRFNNDHSYLKRKKGRS